MRVDRGIFEEVRALIVLLLFVVSWQISLITIWVNSCTAQTQSRVAALGAVTLEDAYRAALTRTEVVGIQNELIVQAEQQFNSARGGVLPNIDFRTSYQRQDPTRAGGTASAFARSEQTTIRFTLSQPIFQGLREFAALSAAKSLNKASLADRERAKILLFTDVANVFYTVLSLEQELESLNASIRLTEQRRSELSDRRRIGRSRPSEVLAVDVQHKTLVSERARYEGNIAAARESFAFLTGLSKDTSLQPYAGSGLDAEANKLPPLEEYLNQVAFRPEIKAGLDRLSASESQVTIARAGHFPTLGLSGNYYLKRPGIISETKWDVTLDLIFPIFQGGTVVANVNAAAARERQTNLELSRLRRQADTEVAQLYQNVSALRKQLNALKEAVEAAERNYKLQSQEYRLGLVTNIEVIQALNSYQETKRAFDRTRHSEQLNRVSLEAAVARGVPSDSPTDDTVAPAGGKTNEQ